MVAAQPEVYGLHITTLNASTILLLKHFPFLRRELALRVSGDGVVKLAGGKRYRQDYVAVARSEIVNDADCLWYVLLKSKKG